jgi:hypothetical protein
MMNVILSWNVVEAKNLAELQAPHELLRPAASE